jgi:hypothetical protein
VLIALSLLGHDKILRCRIIAAFGSHPLFLFAFQQRGTGPPVEKNATSQLFCEILQSANPRRAPECFSRCGIVLHTKDLHPELTFGTALVMEEKELAVAA